MKRCENCGAQYNATLVRATFLDIVDDFPSNLEGLCMDCAVEEYEADTGINIRHEGENHNSALLI